MPPETMTPKPGPVATTRRSALLGAACLCCLPAAVQAAPGVDEVAPGVFVRRGPDAEATRSNAGGIANIGFVIGRDAVLVTDPGGSLADGAWLRAEIRARTDRPIRHVVISHVHPDHAFGAAAFLDDAPEFVGHAGLVAALAARGDFYRDRPRRAGRPGERRAGRPADADRRRRGRDDRPRRPPAAAPRPPDGAHQLRPLDARPRRRAAVPGRPAVRRPRALARRQPRSAGWRSSTRWRRSAPRRAVPGHGPALVDAAPAFAAAPALPDDAARRRARRRSPPARPIDAAVATAGRVRARPLGALRRLPWPQRHPGLQGTGMGMRRTADAGETTDPRRLPRRRGGAGARRRQPWSPTGSSAGRI